MTIAAIAFAFGLLPVAMAGSAAEMPADPDIRPLSGRYPSTVELAHEQTEWDRFRAEYRAAALAGRLEPAAGPAPAETTRATIYFAHDSAALTAEAKARLKAALAANGKPRAVAVHGHADRVGTDAHNRALSARRAEAVRGFLGENGIDPKVIATVRFGESQPAVPTKDGVAEPRNRRAEVYFGALAETAATPKPQAGSQIARK